MSPERIQGAPAPCPFCGGLSYATRTVNGTQMFSVGCASCGVEFKAAWYRGEEQPSKDIIAAWNQRAPSVPRDDTAPTFAEESEALVRSALGWCQSIGETWPEACREKAVTSLDLKRILDELSRLRAALAEATRAQDDLIYCPGDWVCPTCGFIQGMRVMSAHTGNIRASKEAALPCPNDGMYLERLTWKAYAANLSAMLKSEIDGRARADEQGEG